jgi:uncharacterized protein
MEVTIVQTITKILQEQFKDDATGHDWYHIQRVYELACFIQSKEGGNKTVIQLAALLHDISDHKFNGGKLNVGGQIGYELLRKNGCPKEIASKVKDIIDVVSFKGALVQDKPTTLEAKIVQDADRLDAIGAIGIARAFAYGGNKNRPIYDPNIQPVLHESFEAYAKSKSHTINHFYEKLLLLKDRLHTKTAKKIGEERHQYMITFLDQFKAEWNIKSSKK